MTTQYPPGYLEQDKGPKILSVLWTLTGLTTILVVARVWTRIKILKNFGVDDYLIVIAMVLGLAYCGVVTASIWAGFGKHALALPEEKMELAIMLNTVSFLFGILSFTVPKLAVAAMLNRILNPGWLAKTWLWLVTGLAATVSCICIIILFTMCDPPKALWEVHLLAPEYGATCKSVWMLVDYAIFTGSLSAFVDLWLAVYPITVLMKLQMSLRKRLALCAALGLGAIASAMAIIKCTQLNGLADKADYTYGTADLVMWTNIEADVVVIASCIPTLQPLLEVILGNRAMGSYSQGTGNRYKGASKLQDDSTLDHSNWSNPVRKAVTNVESQESQESILPPDEFQRNNNCHALGRIRRTDEVNVEYNSRSAHAYKQSW
ncbi:hypothetical protein N7510_002637 [Penicillium lagena]|uniref:uncharacterized protein n=1 Tax=Penicillium lagena TaxID=94218 RepID=UPI00253F9C17|nr:uncharacterized protein N7510_002637 [Penicillium lagena]KAJ5626328.1 hypothetical protein N7510_002637 [Penicillium lagena]